MAHVIVNNERIDFKMRYSTRAKRISFVVKWNGEAELVIPKKSRVSEEKLKYFVASHAQWLHKQVKKMMKDANKIPLAHKGIPSERVSKETMEKVWEMIERMQDHRDFEVKNVRVRPYKTRWGSCSHDCILSFHYKLSLLPQELLEYVVIHELCHTVHHNHSKDFWSLVEVYCEDYKDKRKALKQYLL